MQSMQFKSINAIKMPGILLSYYTGVSYCEERLTLSRNIITQQPNYFDLLI